MLAGVFTITLLGTSLRAQQAPGGRVLVATVVDGTGKPQVDLGVDDFVVQEEGDEREVLDVHIADYPLVVLIDDGTTDEQLGPIKTAVARFITRVGERPAAIGTLSKPAALIASLLCVCGCASNPKQSDAEYDTLGKDPRRETERAKSLNTRAVENLYAADLAFLQDFYQRINGNGHSRVQVACPHCAGEFEVVSFQV